MSEIRVFPRRTSMTPTDPFAFVGDPPLWRPPADRVSVSCTFTWDKPEAERLAEAWRVYYSDVELGGPAYGSPVNGFTPGRFIRQGVTFTSRGCNNHCPWCLVPEREGPLREILITPGHIVQDNNLLQCSQEHQAAVFAMLRAQRQAAVFSGGLDTRLVTDWTAGEFRRLRIKQVFLAADTDGALEPLRYAVQRLAFLGREKLFCYALIGRETLAQAELRLRAIWAMGCIPFAQLWQPPDKWINYDHAWRELGRTWSRPAAMRTLMKGESNGLASKRN